MTRYVTFLLALAVLGPVSAADARVIRVPADAPSIQEAVETATAGDTIEVSTGRWCGAYFDKKLTLRGSGKSVIVGQSTDGNACDGGPALGTLRIGFQLGAGASGSSVSHFTFDGQGAASNPQALAIAVYAIGASGVTVEHNKVDGGLVGVSNEGGSGWTISHNDLRGLSVRGGTGGFGIIVTQATGQPAPTGNVVTHNKIEGDVPAGAVSAMPGLPDPMGHFTAVRVAGADSTEVSHNDFRLESSASGATRGAGVLVTVGPGGRRAPGSRGPATEGAPSSNTSVEHNDGQRSDFVAVVVGNHPGTSMEKNKGLCWINGEVTDGKPKKEKHAAR